MYKKYLSDRSYENKKTARKVEKVLKYELRRCKLDFIDKMTEDPEDAEDFIVKYFTGKLQNYKGTVNLDLSHLKVGTGPKLCAQTNVLNYVKVTGHDLEKNKKSVTLWKLRKVYFLKKI